MEFENELLKKRESNNQRRNDLSKKFNDEFNNINNEIIKMHDQSKKTRQLKNPDDEILYSEKK